MALAVGAPPRPVWDRRPARRRRNGRGVSPARREAGSRAGAEARTAVI